MKPLFAPILLSGTVFLSMPINANEETALKISELTVCEDVVERVCQGPSRSFPSDLDAVVGFCRVEGATGEAFVTFVWKFEGREVRRTRLTIRGSSYRTWSRKSVAQAPGKWKLEVRDPVERILGSVEFEVAPPPQR